jgi:hypothetical protein
VILAICKLGRKALRRHNEKVAICKSKREALEEAKPVKHLDLVLQASKNCDK